jgi:hypothetical protein
MYRRENDQYREKRELNEEKNESVMAAINQAKMKAMKMKLSKAEENEMKMKINIQCRW